MQVQKNQYHVISHTHFQLYKRDKMSSTYTVTDYLLDRANIHDTVTKLVRIVLDGHELTS